MLCAGNQVLFRLVSAFCHGLLPAQNDPWKLLCLRDLGPKLVVVETKGVSPARSATTCSDGSYQLSFALSGPSRSIPVAAAHAGFKGMTKVYLEKMHKKVIDKPTPSKEEHICKALIRHYLPALSEAEVQAKFDLRGKAAAPLESVLGVDGNMDVALEAIPEHDEAVFNDVLKKHKKAFESVGESDAKQDGASGSGGGDGSGNAAASSEGSGGAKRNLRPEIRPMNDDRLSLELARSLIPDGVGCTMKLDLVLHFRWIVYHPHGREQFIKTCAWNDEVTPLQALQVVLHWVWEEQFAHCKQKCPFDIDLLPDVVLH